tara:strand:+ start:323 stop:655 length:333 start_codon:yes stop_codon:yes gene_type:complete
MDIENTFENLEKIGEQNFDKAEFEKQIFDFVNQLDKIWDILRLASLVRWAQYENENDAIETALDISDRAIEKAVESNNKADLETIIDELEMSMELEERADEVRKILNNLE